LRFFATEEGLDLGGLDEEAVEGELEVGEVTEDDLLVFNGN